MAGASDRRNPPPSWVGSLVFWVGVPNVPQGAHSKSPRAMFPPSRRRKIPHPD